MCASLVSCLAMRGGKAYGGGRSSEKRPLFGLLNITISTLVLELLF